MEVINKPASNPTQLLKSSTQFCADTQSLRIDLPSWLDELFLRFTAIYRGKWTYSLQDGRMLELTRHEWFEALKDFDEQIIKETTADVKKSYKDVPAISEFYEIAKAKAKSREANKADEERKAESKKCLSNDAIQKKEKRREKLLGSYAKNYLLGEKDSAQIMGEALVRMFSHED